MSKKPFRPIVGRYCRQRCGDVVGPVEASGDDYWPVKIGDFLYFENGRFLSREESPTDLVALAPKPRGVKVVPKKAVLVRWAYSHDNLVEVTTDRKHARKNRAHDIDAGCSVGPIVKLEIPAPVKAKGKNK